MKTSVGLLIVLGIFFASCENPIRMNTKVREDGSLHKTIVLEKSRQREQNNMFGISDKTGWVVSIEELSDSTSAQKPSDSVQAKKSPEFRIQFEKEFKSAEEINQELDTPSDSLFHIHSDFEKSFRWFYTYIRYSETIRPINRFKMISPKDYFNQEDEQFIDRLPGEGKSISKADSIFLNSLNERIGKVYVPMAMFNEQYDILTKAIEEAKLDKKWLDTLEDGKEYLYAHIDEMKGDLNLAEQMADSLGLPFPKPASTKLFAHLSKDFNSRLAFMSFANDGNYLNEIEMPWEVVNTNADSVVGNTLYWRPLATKFAFREYTMYAESRRLNWWTTLVSGAIVAITAVVLARRKNSNR